MTWSSIHYFTIQCDGDGCPRSITRLARNVTAARAEIRDQGWRVANVRHPYSQAPALVFDFCPDHPDVVLELHGPTLAPGRRRR